MIFTHEIPVLTRISPSRGIRLPRCGRAHHLYFQGPGAERLSDCARAGEEVTTRATPNESEAEVHTPHAAIRAVAVIGLLRQPIAVGRR